MIKTFFIFGALPSEINHTHLVLIPKIEQPMTPADFCPISLCNVLYKVIAKLLADRLKPLLRNLISPFQLAFVPGSHIQDNYLVAVELFHSMKHKSGRTGWMAIKRDMAKAYDRVEWAFLLAILHNFGFAPQWISWIEKCITTPISLFCFKVVHLANLQHLGD